jgi:hypothetical protein
VQFDPSRPNKLFYYQGPSLREYDIVTEQTSVVKTFPAPLESVGGSVDYVDRTGRIFVVAYGGGVHVWDKQANVTYGGTTPLGIGSGGWAGVSPDGQFLVVANGTFWAYTLDHASHTIGAQRALWNLCGDHGDIGTASNGRSFLVTFECFDSASVYAIDLDANNNAFSNKNDESHRAAQRRSGRQLVELNPADEGHMSCASSDWCWMSVESHDDTFASAGGWRPFKSEILAMNVLTGDVRRMAHHRSRGIDSGYYNTPRISASWDGRKAMWASNYGFNGGGEGYSDLYTLAVSVGLLDLR